MGQWSRCDGFKTYERRSHHRSGGVRHWLMEIQLNCLLPEFHFFNRKQIIFSSSISLSLRADTQRNIAIFSNRHWRRNFFLFLQYFFFSHCPFLTIPLLITSFIRSKLSDRAIPTFQHFGLCFFWYQFQHVKVMLLKWWFKFVPPMNECITVI